MNFFTHTHVIFLSCRQSKLNSLNRNCTERAHIGKAELGCETNIIFKPLGNLLDIHHMVAELMNIHINIHGYSLHVIAGHIFSEIINKLFRREWIITDRRLVNDLNTVRSKMLPDFTDHVLPVHLFKKLCLLITI